MDFLSNLFYLLERGTKLGKRVASKERVSLKSSQELWKAFDVQFRRSESQLWDSTIVFVSTLNPNHNVLVADYLKDRLHQEDNTKKVELFRYTNHLPTTSFPTIQKNVLTLIENNDAVVVHTLIQLDEFSQADGQRVNSINLFREHAKKHNTKLFVTIDVVGVPNKNNDVADNVIKLRRLLEKDEQAILVSDEGVIRFDKVGVTVEASRFKPVTFLAGSDEDNASTLAYTLSKATKVIPHVEKGGDMINVAKVMAMIVTATSKIIIVDNGIPVQKLIQQIDVEPMSRLHSILQKTGVRLFVTVVSNSPDETNLLRDWSTAHNYAVLDTDGNKSTIMKDDS